MNNEFLLDTSIAAKVQLLYEEFVQPQDRTYNAFSTLLYNLKQHPAKNITDFTSLAIQLHDLIALFYDQYNTYESRAGTTNTSTDLKSWKQYRLPDCIEVCAQEANRIIQCLQHIPEKDLLGKRTLMELEQQFGIWQPYASDDDSDDEDWKEETSPFKASTWGCHHSEEEYSESEEDVELIE